MRRASWQCGGLLYMAVVLVWLGPGRAAAEIPRVALPAVGMRAEHLDLIAGTQDIGLSLFAPLSSHGDTRGLTVEATRGYRNGALNLRLAYHVQLTDVDQGSSCDYCEDIVMYRRPFNVAAQLGVHGHTATRTSDAAGFGPAAGLSMSWSTGSRWRDGWLLEGFMGLQSGAVVTPARSRIGVPLRASAGVQFNPCHLHLMLTGRAGFDDIRRDVGERFAYDITFGVGWWAF